MACRDEFKQIVKQQSGPKEKYTICVDWDDGKNVFRSRNMASKNTK